MRTVVLSDLKVGITRLREKGGASEKSLYDLLNGNVNAAGIPESRHGTRVDHTLPPGTKGLCSFAGKKQVFALTSIDPDDDSYQVNVLVHPDPAFAGTLKHIHFAKPFVGALYVAAEFSDGTVRHYWMQTKPTWQAGTNYLQTDAVQPSTPNGFIYLPTTTSSPPVWQPDTIYAIGDEVQPSVYNGFKYVLEESDGVNAASGSTEPDWIASEDALVTEDVDNTPTTPASDSTTGPGGDRYSNLPGYRNPKLGLPE